MWSHALYLIQKVAHTTVTDVHEVMPKCVVTVTLFCHIFVKINHYLQNPSSGVVDKKNDVNN